MRHDDSFHQVARPQIKGAILTARTDVRNRRRIIAIAPCRQTIARAFLRSLRIVLCEDTMSISGRREIWDSNRSNRARQASKHEARVTDLHREATIGNMDRIATEIVARR